MVSALFWSVYIPWCLKESLVATGRGKKQFDELHVIVNYVEIAQYMLHSHNSHAKQMLI